MSEGDNGNCLHDEEGCGHIPGPLRRAAVATARIGGIQEVFR